MGKFLNDPRKLLARLKVGKKNNRALVAVAGALFTKMTGNTNYTTPVPTLLALQTAQTDLSTAMALTDFKRNRGSKAQMQDTINKAAILRNTIIEMINYITQTSLVDATDNVDFNVIIASSGIGLRHVRTRRPATQIPRFIQQNNSKVNPANILRLKWSKPLGTLKGQPIAGYNIVVGGHIVATTTATFHQFDPIAGAGIIEGYIQPFNARGAGRKSFFTIRH